MDIEITPELRQAVMSADCRAMGHLIDVKVGYGEQDDVDVLAGRPGSRGDIDELPHVYCRRCQRVWLILADSPGVDYDTAEQQVADRLRETDPLIEMAVSSRERRSRNRTRGAKSN